MAYVHSPQLEVIDVLTQLEHQNPLGDYDVQPSSTQPNPYIISSWYDLLSDFTPREGVNPAVDYRLVGMGEGVCGMWTCIFCGTANQDMPTVVAHIETEHSPDTQQDA